jgi:hypothetical protein
MSASQPAVQKQTVSLHNLLAEHGAPPTVNYVCLDIEGAERTVLEAFNLRDGPYRLLAPSIEGADCDDLMRGAGYVRALNAFTNETYERYFLHPELARDRPELVKKLTTSERTSNPACSFHLVRVALRNSAHLAAHATDGKAAHTSRSTYIPRRNGRPQKKQNLIVKTRTIISILGDAKNVAREIFQVN